MRLLVEAGPDRQRVRVTGPDGRPAYREITVWPVPDAEQRAAIRRYLVQVEAALEPAPWEMIIALLTRRAVSLNHHGDRTPEQWDLIFSEYAESLTGCSAAHIAKAIRKVGEQKPFFPDLCELLDLCRAYAREDRTHRYNARQILLTGA